MQVEKPSLARGGELNADTWADFVERLKYDCEGEGVSRHHTAEALFIVQAKRLFTGLDMDYADSGDVLVYCDDWYWFSPQEYWDKCDDGDQANLNELAKECDEETFLELSENVQWDILSDLPDHTVTAYQWQWEYVNAHFTRDAAEAFIKRKSHDYRHGLRIYVESQYHAWEFNAIKSGILSGKIRLVADE